MTRRSPLDAPPWIKLSLIALVVTYIAIVVLLPLGAVFTEAFASGFSTWMAAVTEPDAQAAIKLTLLVAAIAVPLNTVFGIIASWAIAKHDFSGKALLISLIDLPFSVSPVVSGLV
jgi:sulfate transport system permease protein